MPQNAIVQRRNQATIEQAKARGVAWNKKGEIIRSREWRKERVKQLQAKRTDSLKRIQNIDAEVAALSQSLVAKEN